MALDPVFTDGKNEIEIKFENDRIHDFLMASVGDVSDYTTPVPRDLFAFREVMNTNFAQMEIEFAGFTAPEEFAGGDMWTGEVRRKLQAIYEALDAVLFP